MKRLSLSVCLVALMLLKVCLAADKSPTTFTFDGKSLFVGMSKTEALSALGNCCKLSPPAESEVNDKRGGEQPLPDSHFVISKTGPPYLMLGTVSFAAGHVVRITRPLDNSFDTSSDDEVALARALTRSISSAIGDSQSNVLVSLQHQRLVNGESDILTLNFQDGRGVELRVGTLDKADNSTNRRDFATLDEILEEPR